jgi:hypothetical protein
MLTYNVDLGNTKGEFAIGNTILVHRKKQTNTLYTINALNELIKSLNNYDAFVFDFCDSEYNELFKKLKNIVSDNYPISIKKGNHYGALHKI